MPIMSINNSCEQRITFRQATQLPWLPSRRAGGTLSPVTVWRWWRNGICGVHLTVESVGQTPVTTESALREFFAAVAQAKANGGRPAPVTAARRRKAIARASDALQAEGIGMADSSTLATA